MAERLVLDANVTCSNDSRGAWVIPIIALKTLHDRIPHAEVAFALITAIAAANAEVLVLE